MERPSRRSSPCPVCYKPEGASKGSCRWCHNLMVCSVECGDAADLALTKLRLSKPYERAIGTLYNVQERIRNMEFKATNGLLSK